MTYTKRYDGRKHDEMRQMEAKINVVKNADGSAMFKFGDTIALAVFYGPKILHPQHMQNPRKGILRVNYDMLSFSVPERKKPGPSRRSQEVSKVTEWALNSVVDLESYPNTVVDVHIMILQANAGTRCAGINAAALALASAGIPMKEMISAVAVGKIDETLIVDLIKEEEDYEDGEGATDIPIAFLAKSGEVALFQLDGRITHAELKEVVKIGRKACKEIYEVQKKALKHMEEK